MYRAIWVFDVDGCLVDVLTGSSLRPGATELLGRLRDGGHGLLLWSAGGDSYARRRAIEHGIDHLFDGFFPKAHRDSDGYYRTDHLPLAGVEATFVDDQPADIHPDRHVVAVRPYLSGSHPDQELSTLIP